MKKIKISIILNTLIILCIVFASVIMFTGFKFMHGYEPVLDTSRIGMFKYFTVDSNLFIGIMALIFIIYDIKLLKGTIKEIPSILYIFKFMATVSVSLTFFVVFVYLGPFCRGGILSMIQNSNLFFHLIVPVISIITFIFFEKTDKLKFKYTFLGLVPTFLYFLFYMTNILIHVENGMVSTKYDWYWFVQKGIWSAFIVCPLMFVFTYIISLILWKFNKIKN